LLSAEEQRLFRNLSVFAGGCTLEAAEDVCHCDLDLLQSLVEKSLLRFAQERYWMLQTIQDFAREQLEKHGETEPMDRHASYFLELAEEAEQDLTGSQASAAMTLLAADHDNLRAARDRFLQQGEGDGEIRLAIAVWPFLMRRGYLFEGRTWLEEALSRTDGARPEQRTQALFGAAILAVWQGEYAHGRVLAEESLALARGLGDARSAARALDALALAAKGEGRHGEAAALFEECRALSREIGDDWLLSIAVNNLGDLALNEGEYSRAAALFEESLRLGRERGDTERVSRSLVNLASVHLEEGREEAALARLKEALGHAFQERLTEVVEWGLEGVAAVAATRGDRERAAVLLAKAEALRNEMGSAQSRFEKARNDRILATVEQQLDRMCSRRRRPQEAGCRSKTLLISHSGTSEEISAREGDLD
jgi:tetratricopeptide (TPR) repeat protein